MALNNFKCNCLTPLHFKGLNEVCYGAQTLYTASSFSQQDSNLKVAYFRKVVPTVKGWGQLSPESNYFYGIITYIPTKLH